MVKILIAISKILKLYENIQHGYDMTKSLPTRCIKEQKVPSWKEINLLLEKVDLDNEIGHLYIVDIKFNEKEATEKHYVHNEIYCSVFEQKKVIDANERSIFQLLQNLKENDGKPQIYAAQNKLTQQCSKKYCSALS